MLPNAEILYLYEAKDTNPNGDPDAENRPRMDYVGRRLLVSDVRLKRYVRDYLLARGEDVWVRSREDGSRTDADGRLEELKKEYQKETGKEAGAKKKDLDPEFLSWYLRRLRDVRLFGAVLPIKAEGEGKGGTGQFVGPVQFDWGYSLHPVEVYTATISSVFAGRTEGGKGEHGTFGKDHRVHYALIAFWGRISRRRGEALGLTPEDLEVLEKGLLEGLLEGATTRSKVGQTPRLYLRVDWREGFRPLGDPRDGLRVLPEGGKAPEAIRSVGEYRLEASALSESLSRFKESIARVRLWVHPDLKVEGLSLEGFPVEEVKV
ncbi:type I-B CRISPR-associated protein Cas7/Csh2 [Thermus filiformis]|uniref:CRISPR-associated protein Csh2 n=1 Tax=Thermus filiformis TaxID=276 RepID=A0A0A2WSS5_THEFI|nr:type I-B CRISPR-associated protein Cas7/Csh2 [Thermus filiformis]KGQ22883.1 CRISPR-associated protein Csh2 [Thermus filiformis]